MKESKRIFATKTPFLGPMRAKLFAPSPMRGWRWLAAFMGGVMSAAIVYAFADSWNSSISILVIVPVMFLLVGAGLLYVGLFADDAQVRKFTSFMGRFGPW